MDGKFTTESVAEGHPMETFELDDIMNDEDEDDEFDLSSEIGLGDYDVDSMDETAPGEMDKGDKIGWPEQLRMIHFRSHINELNDAVEKCQYNVDKTREELKKCNAHLRDLEAERDDIFQQVEDAEKSGNTAALYRLRATHEKLCREIDGEQEVIRNIRERIDQAEYEFAKADVERGKYVLLEEELIQKEQQLQREKTEMVRYRIHKEETMAKQGALQQQKQRRLREEALRDHERRHLKAVQDAQESHDRVETYLCATIEKMKKRQEEEESRYNEDMERKVQMLLKLKKDVIINRENLRALRARDVALHESEKEKEKDLRKKILEQGGNPDMEMLIKKRVDSFEKEKIRHEAKQREGQAKILDKILLEEMVIKKRRKQQHSLFVDPKDDKSKIVKPHPKKPLRIFEKFCQDTGAEDLMDQLNTQTPPPKGCLPTEGGKIRAAESADMLSLALADSSDSETEMQEETSVNLAVPEFEGLWDQHKPYHVPKDTGGELRLPGATKMEREIMAKVLQKHRQGIIVKQVAAGKQFEGRAFYSKPDIIHFKDFDVGQCYKKKVILTNASYSVNYCKFMGLTERLKDFIKIDFSPPGQMSAGLTCDMLVTFKPMINEDLEGEVYFMAQTGPFSIPLKCTTKKCDLRTDTAVVEFGTTVTGETLKRPFILNNKGAQGTQFDFFKVTGMKQRTMTTAETSFGRLTTADTIHAISPDSMEAADKQKQEKDSKKKSSEDLAKLAEDSQDLGEGGLPGDGVSSPLSQAQGLDPDKAGDNLEEVMSPDLAVSEMDDFGTLDGMKVGPISSGDIGPFSSVKLEIIWQPTIPGKVDSEFLISFADPLSENISVHAVGKAIDVPVWVERQSVDLKICLYDRLYQDTIVVNNRSKTALRLKFEVCKELHNHLELLPKTGYIQAQSQFSAQLKFLPRKGLAEEAGKYFDPATGVLEALMIIRVADQTSPVPFTVHAVVTNSDMEFSVANINFNCCTVYESVKTPIQLINKSILPQRFGFVGLPDYVEVQPEDGFGTLLPLETLDLDVIFSPQKARAYEFDLVCKSLINREFKVKCKGIGVLPPLELSNQVIHFAATALYDISSAAVHIINSHTSSNEFTHPVPRIGKGDIAPVGPTSFELKVPDKCHLSISPTVGTILPGEKARVLIHFAPKLEEEIIRQEAVRMATKLLEAKAERDYQEALRLEMEAAEYAQQAAAKKGGKGARATSPKGKGKGGAAPAPGQGSTVPKPGPIQPPDPNTITKDSPAYHAAIGSLLRQFKGAFHTVKIPIFVASGACGNPGEISYSIHNTLYLEVHCPTIKPPLVVISNHGKRTVDFGEVCIGQSVTQPITLQNNSDTRLILSSSILNTCGPFNIVNALRPLEPNETHTALISFTPHASEAYQEQLEIKTKSVSLYLKLTGHGVLPKVTLTPDAPEFPMGPALVGEYCERQFKMNNTSSLAIEYSIRLESQSTIRHSNAQGLPAFIRRDGPDNKFCVGTQNKSGQAVFDLVPMSGTIPAGGSKEITVTFAPDHESKHYSDGVYIELFNQEESHFFKLTGAAYPSIMYLDGYDELLPNVESLCVSEKAPVQEDEDSKPPPPSVLLMLKCTSTDTEPQPVPRDILVGCVRTMAVSQKKEVRKKNGEYSFENLQAVNAKGFNVDPPKGMVEAGVKRPVTFTWTPPSNLDSSQVAESSIMVTLKGETSEQYKIILRGMLVTA